MADHHDGDQVKADANYGFAIGDRGFLNVTAEYLDRGGTNRAAPWSGDIFPGVTGTAARSEEHTSELQSQSNLVCRLLLEKKIHTLRPGAPPPLYAHAGARSAHRAH